MSRADIPLYPPLARNDEVEGAIGALSWLDAGSSFWSDVHEEAQKQLRGLEQKVRQEIANAQVTAGRTRGKSFYLFSYKMFALGDEGLDPVVAGMTFLPAENAVRIEADISGEETGDIIVSLPETAVQRSREKLIEATSDVARKLSGASAAVVAELKNSSRTTG